MFYGLLGIAAGLAISRQGVPPRFDNDWVPPRPGANGLSALLYLAVGLTALYFGVTGIELSVDSTRVRRMLIGLVGLSLVQALVTLSAVSASALMLGMAGVGPGILALIGVAPLVQIVLTGLALHRLCTGWSWVRLFMASGVAAAAVFGLCLIAITDGILNSSTLEGDRSFPAFQVLAASHLLPLSLAIWLTKHGATDEFGGEAGTGDDMR